MGIIWRLAREDTKECFDLDKGNWTAIFDRERWVLNETVETLANKIFDRVYPHLTYDYCSVVARRIVNWCGSAKVRLFDDCGDDPALGYPDTADRFSPSYVVGYEDYKPRK